MAVIWAGPFSDAPSSPITGISNHVTGAGTWFPRYSDGDPVSAFVARERRGNLNYIYNLDRRLVVCERFNGPTSADPTKCNVGTAWTDRPAIYTFWPVYWIPTARRGDTEPPRFDCRIRARMNGGGASEEGTVRIYTARDFGNVRNGWAGIVNDSAAENYAEFDVVGDTYAVASPTSGWTSAAVQIARAKHSDAPVRVAFPAADARREVWAYVTWMILAAVSKDGSNGPLVARMNIWEEAPGG